MDYFIWSQAAKERNKNSSKHEPIQPFLFLSFIEFGNVETVIDIGANVGLYSLVSSLAPQVECIMAFEPDDDSRKELERNIYLNSLENRIQAHSSVVSSSTKMVEFGTHSPLSGINGVVNTSIHDEELYSKVDKIKAISLDELPNLQNKVLALKVDVEGHELEVLRGASNLLKSNCAVIQIECYEGHDIEMYLQYLGYFKFFSAGYDHYFSNIENFINPLFVHKSLEYATAWLVETSSSRLPKTHTIKNSLSIKLTPDFEKKKLQVEVTLLDGYFSSPEFAFYLIVNGKKLDEKWYQEDTKAFFDIENDFDSIEVKAFVRERNCDDKKFAISEYLNKPITGYRATSAVSNSLGTPSAYAQRVSEKSYDNSYETQLDFDPLFCDQNLQESSLLIEFQKRSFFNSLERSTRHKKFNVLSSSFDVLHYNIETKRSVEEKLENLSLKKLAIYIWLDEHCLIDYNLTLSRINTLLKTSVTKATIICQGLINLDTKEKLEEWANLRELNILWLYPLSTPIRNLLTNKRVGKLEFGSGGEKKAETKNCPGLLNKLDFGC
tara:strand:- start:254 stop:1909 length:1656 start_codon:yes stop_codon:yes gene_type:complete